MTHKKKDLPMKEWRLGELIVAKVDLQRRINKGEFQGDAFQKAQKSLLDMKDELKRRNKE